MLAAVLALSESGLQETGILAMFMTATDQADHTKQMLQQCSMCWRQHSLKNARALQILQPMFKSILI